MPVVSREEFRLYDEIGKKIDPYIKVTTYSARDQKFKIELPDYMHGVLEFDSVRGDSQKEVDDAFRLALSEYEARIDNPKKVIAYSIISNVHTEIDGEPFVRETMGLYGEAQSSVGLALWFKVCYETNYRGDSYRRSGLKWYDEKFREVQKPSYHSQIHSMEWTEAREAFFQEFTSRITQLVVNAEEFVNSNENLIHMIDHKMNLPLIIMEPDAKKRWKNNG